MYDFLIVGAGLFGATVAHRLSAAGKTCLVIDKREHVGGNCYTEMHDGILIHKYGPHYFHTSSERVWRFMSHFGQWRAYVPHVKAKVDERVFSFPINLLTLHQLWGVETPEQAWRMLNEKRVQVQGDDAEAHLLRTVGEELYETFFKGYTTKQWGLPPSKLPSSIVTRIPVRLSFDDNYHFAKYQALPVEGYTPIVQAMLEGSEVELGVDFKTLRGRAAKRVIFTGSVDELFSGPKLPYRSLRFDHETVQLSDYQGCAQMNYPNPWVPYTRIVEHKHLHGGPPEKTIITREYPSGEGEPYYPIPTAENLELARTYRAQAESEGYIVGGRLGAYKYMDMDGAVGAALVLADRILNV